MCQLVKHIEGFFKDFAKLRKYKLKHEEEEWKGRLEVFYGIAHVQTMQLTSIEENRQFL